MCEVACSLIHSPEGELNPVWTRIKIDHAPQVSRVSTDGFGFMPALCHHCANPPPCAEVCPTDAFYYDPKTQAAVIDQDKCIQCMECVPGCPFDTVFVAPTGELLKCDLCGGDPACVKACSTRANNTPDCRFFFMKTRRPSVKFYAKSPKREMKLGSCRPCCQKEK